MSLDPDTLCATIRDHGPVCRVVVAETRGSAPREAGAAMLVWADGQRGTIGGGALEHDAVLSARRMLAEGPSRSLAAKPLGPALGQCCGGVVTLLWEMHKSAGLPDTGGTTTDGVFIRPVTTDATGDPPPALLRRARRADMGDILLLDGWVAERLAGPRTPVWIYGAGHVGRAVAATLAPLPDFGVTLIDTHISRLPAPPPEGVTPLIAADPVRVIGRAPATARHLVMTYSHELDLDLCHRLLAVPGASIGLIGSHTKWARFSKRLRALGHAPATLRRITCPVGDPSLGKHPRHIAVGVAAALIKEHRRRTTGQEIAP